MSKRSYRRLAVVTGAALALGSMAPAMAARVDVMGTADVDADPSLIINDVVNVTDALPPLPTTAVLGVTNQVVGTVTTTALGAPNLVLGNVFSLLSGVSGITDGVLGIVDGALISADANVNVLGVADVDLGADVLPFEALALVGGIDGVTGLAGAPLALAGSTLGTVTGIATPLVGTATGLALGTVGTAVGTVTTLPGTVIGTTGLLTGLLNVSASGNANVLASVLGTF